MALSVSLLVFILGTSKKISIALQTVQVQRDTELYPIYASFPPTVLAVSGSRVRAHTPTLSRSFRLPEDFRQHRTIASAGHSESFAPARQFPNREILRNRCQRKLAYGCGIPLAGTSSIPPVWKL